MSTSEVESYKDSFILPSNKAKAYIYDKGYFLKTLLPYNPIEGKRYCEIKCLLPIDTSNPSIICNKVFKTIWRDTSTGNLHRHLRKCHSKLPRSKEEEAIYNTLEGIFILYSSIYKNSKLTNY